MKHQARVLHQSRGCNKLALFLEMRLGKSLVAIRWANRSNGKRLIVCPLSVIPDWQREIRLEGKTSTQLEGPFARDSIYEEIADTTYDYYLCHYQGLYLRGHKTHKGKPKAVPSVISSYPWTTVILDESARIRNPQTLQAKVCNKWLARAPRKCLMSGLADPETRLDYFEQMRFLWGRFLGCDNYWKFRLKFFRNYGFFPDWQPKPGTVKRISRVVHAKCFCITRKSVGLGSKVIKENRFVVLPSDVRKIYREAEKTYVFKEASTKWQFGLFNGLRRLAGGRPPSEIGPSHNVKVQEILELVTGELKGQPLVIWFCFRSESRAVEKALRGIGIVVRRIVGKTPHKVRQQYRKRFDSGEVQVLCMSVATGQYGLDLSTSDTAIYYSEPPSHDQYAQSMERIVHPKKKRPLLAISLIAKDTLEEHIHSLLLGKRLGSRMIQEKMVERLREQWQRKKSA